MITATVPRSSTAKSIFMVDSNDNKYLIHVGNILDIKLKSDPSLIVSGKFDRLVNDKYLGIITKDEVFLCVDIDDIQSMIIKEQDNSLPKNDNVEHPNHYQSESGLEAWDVIAAFTADLSGVEAFDTGNVLKYMCRWKKKNGLEDLKKAKEYIEHLIAHVEKLEKEND